MSNQLYLLRKRNLAEISRQTPSHIQALADEICELYQQAVVGVLFYGSCLWQKDVIDGMPDFFVIVSNYDQIWSDRKWLRLAGRCLPPNVFYHQMELPDGIIRCKYAVLSIDQLEAGCQKWFHSFIFGRLAQPIALINPQNTAYEDRINQALYLATKRLLDEGLGLMNNTFTALELWRKTLICSYQAELRPEKENRIDLLIEQSSGYFQATAESYLASLPGQVRKLSAHQYSKIKPGQVLGLQAKWLLRSVWGKGLSLLRLAKAYFTFSNAIEYVAYKIERHSGEKIELSSRAYKWPWLFLPGLLLKLWYKKLIR